MVAVSQSQVGAATASGQFVLSKRASDELAAKREKKESEARVAALMRRLWAATQVEKSMALKDYLDYHLSMFIHFEREDSQSGFDGRAYLEAWESALEDWETDTGGSGSLNYRSFRDSVEELVEAYSQARPPTSPPLTSPHHTHSTVRTG